MYDLCVVYLFKVINMLIMRMSQMPPIQPPLPSQDHYLCLQGTSRLDTIIEQL